MFVGITSRRAKKSYNGLEKSAKRWEIDAFAMFLSLFNLQWAWISAPGMRGSPKSVRGGRSDAFSVTSS